MQADLGASLIPMAAVKSASAPGISCRSKRSTRVCRARWLMIARDTVQLDQGRKSLDPAAPIAAVGLRHGAAPSCAAARAAAASSGMEMIHGSERRGDL